MHSAVFQLSHMPSWRAVEHLCLYFFTRIRLFMRKMPQSNHFPSRTLQKFHLTSWSSTNLTQCLQTRVPQEIVQWINKNNEIPQNIQDIPRNFPKIGNTGVISVHCHIYLSLSLLCLIYMIYIFNRSWVDTRWQQYIAHLHTNSTLTHTVHCLFAR
jgi:hypothetical protein